MFELFRTYDGEEYTVYVREDGKRFYVDFEEQVLIYIGTRYSLLYIDWKQNLLFCRNGDIFLTLGMRGDHFCQ